MSTKSERYISNQEKVKTRAIARILRQQKVDFIDFLERLPAKMLLVVGKKQEDLESYLDSIKGKIPDYLKEELPAIMEEGAKESIQRYRDFLPEGYALTFDIPGTPAAEYLRQLVDLHLSQRQGSILKTTRDELRKIIADGVEQGLSYGQIAKQIQETDPFVFSKYRAKLIAVNEVGRAYGWANHEPARELDKQGYVLVKKWTTSRDDKVRETHRANEADGEIPLASAFSGTGDLYAPSTVDINCRCTSTHKIIGIKSLKCIGRIEGVAGKSNMEIKQIFEKVRKWV